MIIGFDRFELDTEQKSVVGPDGKISLRPQTLDVLCHLIERAPVVVSREELLDAVWNQPAASISAVAQTITELRQALGDSSNEPRLIATRHRLGYQFIGIIHSRVDKTSSSINADRRQGDGTLPAVRLWPWPVLLIMFVVVAGLSIWSIEYRGGSPSGERMPVLAVAQMVNVSEDPDLNWLGPALETYLGHALVELGAFRILSVDQGALDDESQLGNIDFLIEGRFLTAGVGESVLLANVRRPGSSELVASVEASLSGWDVASLTISAATAIRDRLGFSMPPDADPGSIRLRLPRRPSSQQAYFLAVEAIGNHQPEQALREIDQAREHEPGNPLLDHVEALARKHRGDWQAARLASEKAMTATRLWPQRDRLELEATAALLNFDFNRAADRLQALTEFYPEPNSTRRLIEVLIDAGRLQTANEALQSLRMQHPHDPWVALLRSQLAGAENDHGGRLSAARDAVLLAREQDRDALLPPSLLAEAGALIELGQLDEARKVVNDLFGLDELLIDADLATTHLTLARIQFQQGELSLALNSAEQARSLFEIIPHPAGTAESLLVAGAIHDRAGSIDASLEVLEQAVEQFAALGDKRRLARSNVQLGIALMGARQTDAALDRLEEGARHFREAGDRQGEGAALLNRATLLARGGRLEDAEPVFQRGLEAFVDAGDLRGQAIALGNLAAIAGNRRDVVSSIDLAEQALVIFETLGAQTDIARVSYNLALTYRRLGELDSAERRFQQSADAFAGQGAILMQSRALASLASLLISMGRFDELDDVLDTIDGLELEDPIELSRVHAVRGNRALSMGMTETAMIEFQTAYDLVSTTEDENHLLVARLNLARVELAQGLSVRAEQTARDLLFAFGEIRQVNRQIDSLLLLAEALIEQHRIDDAQASLTRANDLLTESPDAEQQSQLARLGSQTSAQDRTGK